MVESSSPLIPFKVIICVDMDAFYAQIEQVRLGIDPSKPFALRQWNNLIAVNYPARKLGIKTYMGYWEAKQKCPDLIFAHIDTLAFNNEKDLQSLTLDEKRQGDVGHDRVKEKVSLEIFREACDKIIQILKKYAKIVEKASIDEAFLDVTAEVKEQLNNNLFAQKWQDAWPGKLAGGEHFVPETELDKALFLGGLIAQEIRMDIYNNLKYTGSAGISYNKMLAKLASGMNKPFNQATIVPRYVISAIENLDVKKLRNFGGKVHSLFKEKGFDTIGSIQKLNLKQIQEIIGDDVTAAKWIYFRCRGYDGEGVEEKTYDNKSITSSKIFSAVTDPKKLQGMLEVIAADLAVRLVNFYEQSGLIPQSISISYYDQSSLSSRTKSLNVNFNRNKAQFRKIVWEKAQELIESVKKQLYPCSYLHLTASRFIKGDFEKYKFDLESYAKEKGKELKNKRSFDQKSSENTMVDPLSKTGEEKLEHLTEKFFCEKCAEHIELETKQSHMDFHLAEELDRDLNPFKKKYRQAHSIPDRLENVSHITGDKPSAKSAPGTTETEDSQEGAPLLKKAKTSDSVLALKNDKKAEKTYKFKPIDSFFKKKTNP
mgnify:FL=1